MSEAPVADTTAKQSDQAETTAIKGGRKEKAIQAWYDRLSGQSNGGRAVMARLRRCHTPDAAACEPEVYLLARALKEKDIPVSTWDLTRAGFIAGILSHVRADLPGRTMGECLAASRKAVEEGEKSLPSGKKPPPRYSRDRFVRLCDTQNLHEAFPAFRRAIAIVDDKAPVLSLAAKLVAWGDDRPNHFDPSGRQTRADAARIRFAQEYYGAL